MIITIGPPRIKKEDTKGNTPAAVAVTAPSPKQPLPTAKAVDTQSVTKRLQSELMALMMSGDTEISAFPHEDNIFCWKGTEYKLSVSFSNDHPFKPTKVKFEAGCFRPIVDVYGTICLDILQDKWSSAYDIKTILLSIQSLLGEYGKMVEKLYKAPNA